MIEFKELKYKNILSYGNNYTTITFEEGITRYSGKNGDGKSTLIEALNFVLFGSPYRKIKKGQLVNSKNKKGMEVHLTFQKQDDEYLVIRGIKPDIFKIYRNAVLVPVSSSVRGYQEILSEDILQFDENIFNQVTVKSLTKNMSFMSLVKGEKRKIIENMLDIEIFSIMGKNIKTRVDACEVNLKTFKKDVENNQLLIDQERENLEKLINLKRKMEEEANRNIQIYQDEINELKATNQKYNKGLDIIARKKSQKVGVQKEIAAFKQTIKDRDQLIAKHEATVNLHDKKIEFLSKTCGECPKIKELMVAEDISTTTKAITHLKKLSVESSTLLTEQEAELTKIDNILGNERFLTESITKNKARISTLEQVINKSKESIIEVDESKLKGYIATKKGLVVKYNEEHKKKTHLVLLRSLYSDDGIKTFIIKKYLPTINKLLNTYLAKFQTDIIFNFDEEFNEVVLTKYKEDFTYESFSQGQKKRIDLAIMFAFIKFAQLKNKKSDTNLLVMDEVLTSLDVQGTESVMEVLSDYKNKANKSIITINHLTDIDPEFFDFSFEVVIEKGYSKVNKIQL
jgi:DNA repair exonuclease SbcCD ATPase subunit